MYKIPEPLEALYKEVMTTPDKRASVINKIAQEYLKPLQGQELHEAVYYMLDYFCKHEKEWKGNLMIPEFYRANKKELISKDIWYPIKEFFMWAALYPDELEQQFIMNSDGSVSAVGDSKIRIVTKEVKKEVIREGGKYQTREIRPSLESKIKSGFTQEQKGRILDACIVGLVPAIKGYKDEAAKKPKKSTKKSVAEVEEPDFQQHVIVEGGETVIETIIDDTSPQMEINDIYPTTKKTVKKKKAETNSTPVVAKKAAKKVAKKAVTQ